MTNALCIPALIAALAQSQAHSASMVTPEVRAPRVRFRTFDSAAAKTKVSYCKATDELKVVDAIWEFFEKHLLKPSRVPHSQPKVTP